MLNADERSVDAATVRAGCRLVGLSVEQDITTGCLLHV